MYDVQIEKLEFLIENWDEIKLLKDSTDNFQIYHGICYNCYLNPLPISLKVEMFKLFPKFSGNLRYPLGEEEYFNLRNFADNPDRLLLAKHCLSYLKIHSKYYNYYN